MRIELLWPDGALITGASWTEVESAIRASQWRSFRTRREFRKEMRRRATNWSGLRIRNRAPWTAKQFIEQLADAGMFVLNVSDDGD